jgi:DNA invertase Pin-like site-specific DNA recombinase
MIRQRVNAGLKRAKAQGKQLGRSRIDVAPEKRIQAQLRVGKGMLKVARECPALLFWWQQGLWR